MCECARGTTKFDRKYKSLFFRNVFFRMFLFFSNWNYFAAIAHRKQNNTQTHSDQGPDKGVEGQRPGSALLVKRRNSKWPFTNEPEVRFRFYILVKVGPTIRPGLNVCLGVPTRLAKCPGISLQ